MWSLKCQSKTTIPASIDIILTFLCFTHIRYVGESLEPVPDDPPGLWHGSTPMFAIWGALHGLALILHKACKKLFLDRVENTLPVRCISWFVTFLFISIAWVFFRASDLTVCEQIFSQITLSFDIAYLPYFVKARPLWVIVVVLALLIHSIREHQFLKIQDWYVRSHWLVKLVLFLLVIQLAIEFSTNNVQPFIYSNF